MLTNKRSIETVTVALRRHSSKVQLNATWKQLNTEHGIGTLIGSSALQLSDADHVELRAMLKRDMTFDPLAEGMDAFEGDRLKRAQNTRDEKVGGGTIADHVVMVASLSGELDLASGTYRHPIGGTLSVPAAELHGLKQVLLIENLHVMFALHHYCWPQEVMRIPMLFRGSPQITPRAVKIALSGIEEMISFPDYDPQGWMNTLTAKARAIIVPSPETVSRIVGAKLDKPKDFETQVDARLWLGKSQIEQVQTMLRDEVAISQESIAGMPLEILQLAPGV
jgi:hypothetical protein